MDAVLQDESNQADKNDVRGLDRTEILPVLKNGYVFADMDDSIYNSGIRGCLPNLIKVGHESICPCNLFQGGIGSC